MRLYHPTKHVAEILRDGFGETTGTYLTETDHSGVWLFDRPINPIRGDEPDVILELEIPESVVAPFEWSADRPYRMFLMPAALNLYGPPRVSDESLG